MSSSLEKQVYIYSIGTESFYTNKEHIIHNQIMECHLDKKEINEKIQEYDLLLKNKIKEINGSTSRL